jgi:nucleoside-diphosphate-sugar epimerase
MHALVTGGGGFLGGYIVEALLARGDRVRSFGRGDYPQLRAQGVEVVRGGLCDRDAVARACRDVDCVFHAAAIPGIRMRERQYDEVNRVGTENVLAACQAAGVSRLVYTSSPSVVFAGQDQCGVDESVPYGFRWLADHRAYYSLSKARAEKAVLAANGETLRTCALRPHLVWGPGDTQLIPRLIARARSGRLRRVGDGTNLVDVTYVENAAEAHLLAADRLADRCAGSGNPRTTELASDALVRPAAEAASPGGKAYFISQGKPVKCWDWVDEILALVELPPVEKAMSFRAAWRIGAICEAAYRVLRLKGEPPMTRFLAAQLAMSHWFDIGAARRELGYQPRVSTEEGMRRLKAWLNLKR